MSRDTQRGSPNHPITPPTRRTSKEAALAFYATGLYLPASALGRWWRRRRAAFTGRGKRFLQETRLPAVHWKEAVAPSKIRFLEPEKRNGNIRPSELAVLCHFAADCRPDKALFEIGTFDGRTTLNLAANSPENNPVYTLDLPPDADAGMKSSLDSGEVHLTKASSKPRRFDDYSHGRQITQLWGDSSQFDFSPYHGKCGLVFVDGSHAYDNVISDSQAALRMVAPGGAVIWHDYGIWEGATKALEEMEDQQHLGLQAIRGTSLVFWRKR
jgi:predicted O-methyltransferase YrrM